jgi:hypothetical protein
MCGDDASGRADADEVGAGGDDRVVYQGNFAASKPQLPECGFQRASTVWKKSRVATMQNGATRLP